MPPPARLVFTHWKANFSLICCFFLTFFLGLNFWQFLLPNSCPSSLPIAIDYRSFYEHFYYRTLTGCTNERTKIFLTIAVLSSYERLFQYLPAMFETWVLTTTIEIEIILFIEENSFDREEFFDRLFANLNQRHLPSCLFMVKLKHVQNEYPPQRKSFYAMKFLHMFYRDRTAWILRLDDNAYVNIPQLIPWLKSIDHRQALYIGQGGTGRPSGPAIHFPPGKYFCMGGSGVILSSETLNQLGPWLDQCYQSETLTIHEDVELGRCILTHLNLSCTNAYDSKLFFYHHYGPRYLFGYDFTPSILSRALILHPIGHQNTFEQIFHFYQRSRHHHHRASRWTIIDPINYVTFINGMEFDLVRDIHYQFIDVRWKAYIDSIVQSYLEHLQKVWYQRSSNWTNINRKYLFGYHRLIPKYGLELFVEILFNVRSSSIASTRSTIIRKRIHLRQQFRVEPQFDYREIDLLEEKSPLNLIVVSSNRDQALERLLENFHREILAYPERQPQFTLTILYFLHSNNAWIDHLNQFIVRYPSNIRVMMNNQTTSEYNRGLGRQLALKYFTEDQLLFFLDVDVQFTGQSLINTRRLILHQLSSSSCAVYFPIVYSIFSNLFTRKNHAGLFSIYGFGNVVVRKRDLERVGGWEVNNHEWGNEDGDLFARFVNISTECTIFRVVEPGFRHSYHRKMCDEIVNPIRQKMCFDAEANLLGSPVDMIQYLFENQILKMASNDDEFRSSPVLY